MQARCSHFFPDKDLAIQLTSRRNHKAIHRKLYCNPRVKGSGVLGVKGLGFRGLGVKGLGVWGFGGLRV